MSSIALSLSMCNFFRIVVIFVALLVDYCTHRRESRETTNTDIEHMQMHCGTYSTVGSPDESQFSVPQHGAIAECWSENDAFSTIVTSSISSQESFCTQVSSRAQNATPAVWRTLLKRLVENKVEWKL
jgi:hypothetical protein